VGYNKQISGELPITFRKKF